MHIKTTLDGTKATIALAGRLTVATSPELEEAVHQIADTAVDYDVDLSELEYISSAGLRVLVSTQKIANHRGGTLRLYHPTESVREVFEMTGLSDVMTIVE